jgi:hypothetical protein
MFIITTAKQMAGLSCVGPSHQHQFFFIKFLDPFFFIKFLNWVVDYMSGGVGSDYNQYKRCFTISLKGLPRNEVLFALEGALRYFNVVSVTIKRQGGDGY